MKVVLCMNNRMVTMHEDIRKLNQRVWGDNREQREQPQRRRSIRTQIPCYTFEQLQLLDEELGFNDTAMNELVWNCIK